MRWGNKAGQKERHLFRARADSLVPSAREWEGSIEAAAYRSDAVTGGHDAAGIVTLDQRYAHPKKRVIDFPDLPLKPWKSPPDVTLEVNKWIWRSIEKMVGAAAARYTYPSTAGSDSEGTANVRKRDGSASERKPHKTKKKAKGGKEASFSVIPPSSTPEHSLPPAPAVDSSRASLHNIEQRDDFVPPPGSFEEVPEAVDEPMRLPEEVQTPFQLVSRTEVIKTGDSTPTRTGLDFLQHCINATLGNQLLVFTPRRRGKEAEELQQEPPEFPDELLTGPLTPVQDEPPLSPPVLIATSKSFEVKDPSLYSTLPPVLSPPLVDRAFQPVVTAPVPCSGDLRSRTIPVTCTVTTATETLQIPTGRPIITKIELLPVASPASSTPPVANVPTQTFIPVPVPQSSTPPVDGSNPGDVLETESHSTTGTTPSPSLSLVSSHTNTRVTVPVRKLGLEPPLPTIPGDTEPILVDDDSPDTDTEELAREAVAQSTRPMLETVSLDPASTSRAAPSMPAPPSRQELLSPVSSMEGSRGSDTASEAESLPTAPTGGNAKLWYLAEAEDMREANVAKFEAELVRIAQEEALALAHFARRRADAQEGSRMNREAVRRIQAERATLLSQGSANGSN